MTIEIEGITAIFIIIELGLIAAIAIAKTIIDWLERSSAEDELRELRDELKKSERQRKADMQNVEYGLQVLGIQEYLPVFENVRNNK